MELDVLFLSRLQFAFTIMFHYLFPPLTIGLGWIMVVMEGMYLKTGNKMFENMARFWTKIFAVNFAMGVASGIVMEFEFGTNWATYSRFVGDVFGSALAAEGIFAFFLESGFLAVLVFGWDRVGKKVHFLSTVLVACGALFSSVWIVVANSWQQTPAGYHIVGEGMNARAEITDFWAMVFNPSTVPRLTHTVIGAFILAGFFVMSISAYYLLKRRHKDFARKSFGIGLGFATIFSVLALVTGHFQADKVAETQPAKLAAFEGIYETAEPGEGTPMYIWGFPNDETEQVDYAVEVPSMLSFLVHFDLTTPVKGLDQIPEKNEPPVHIPFYSYHIMIGLGTLFILLTFFASYHYWRNTLFDKRWLLWVFVFAVIAPYIANQLGWIAAEVGRQPWLVYGELRTPDGLSKAVEGSHVLTSIIMFGLIYALLFALWLFIMHNKIQHGPVFATPDAGTEGEESWMTTATRRADPSGESMGLAHGSENESEENSPYGTDNRNTDS